MVRETSIQAYRSIIDEGLLGKRKAQVYDVLFHHGPLTGNQISAMVKQKHGSWGHSETVKNRLTEMRNVGVVRELKTVTDPISGREVILWDVTPNLPVKLDKPLKVKCKHCDGKGVIVTQQGRLL